MQASNILRSIRIPASSLNWPLTNWRAIFRTSSIYLSTTNQPTFKRPQFTQIRMVRSSPPRSKSMCTNSTRAVESLPSPSGLILKIPRANSSARSAHSVIGFLAKKVHSILLRRIDIICSLAMLAHGYVEPHLVRSD